LAVVAVVSAKTSGAANVKEILGKFQKRLFLITAFLSIINQSASVFSHPNTRSGHFIVLTKKANGREDTRSSIDFENVIRKNQDLIRTYSCPPYLF
jgi:hypothetical protein